MAGQFEPQSIGQKDCSDEQTFGQKSTRYDYIVKSLTSDEDYPADACAPWIHGNFQVDNIQLNTSLTGSGSINISNSVTATQVSASEVTASGITLTSRKAFDISHPNKNGWRLRHICLEGPESAVYYRGRLKNSNVIQLPEYWVGLVDPESITVSLTQIGYSQDLIVERIEWGKKILIKSGTGSNIDCYFLVHGERIDGEKLIVEYEGNDYPGDNSQYSINK